MSKANGGVKRRRRANMKNPQGPALKRWHAIDDFVLVRDGARNKPGASPKC